jgi:alginate O-acetyltransferase complex protein AlgI
VTFLLVTMAWVLFRAPDLPAAQRILSAMLGLHGWGGVIPREAALWIAALLAIVWFTPNTQTLMRLHQPVLPPQPLPASRLAWQPGLGSALITASMAVASILLLQRQSAFLYFQF